MEVVRAGTDSADLVFHQMAEIHREAISEGFLSSLGERFLTGLYRHLSGMENAFAFVAEEEGRVLGFIVGALDTGSVYRSYAQKGGLSAILTLAPKLLSPRRVARVMETVLYPGRKRNDGLPEPEILNFCVRSDQQGKGVGGALFQALCTEFARRGVGEIRIVTGEGQVSAQHFYEAKGAVFAMRTEVHRGTASRVYTYQITRDA